MGRGLRSQVPASVPNRKVAMAGSVLTKPSGSHVFVSPQLWAWRRGRILQVKRDVAKMLVLFPFEEAIYRDAGKTTSGKQRVSAK